MQPKDSWSFSCPLTEVNVRRILREARCVDGNVVRFTIDGKVYTAWREDLHPPLVDPRGWSAYWSGADTGNEVFRWGGPHGEVRIVTPTADDLPEYTNKYRIQGGDHVAALLDRVETTVEVFAPAKR
jgi:hypothetical protein